MLSFVRSLSSWGTKRCAVLFRKGKLFFNEEKDVLLLLLFFVKGKPWAKVEKISLSLSLSDPSRGARPKRCRGCKRSPRATGRGDRPAAWELAAFGGVPSEERSLVGASAFLSGALRKMQKTLFFSWEEYAE